MSDKIWFITGASRGFGRIWAEGALARGDKVVATARSVNSLSDLAKKYGDAVLPLALDVTKREQVEAVIPKAHAHFGRLDVVINNAGYALLGAVEEAAEADVRAEFDTVRSHLVLLQQWIGNHLDDPDLTLQRIAGRYGISVRQLHRLFEPTGETVSQWIERQRLERCYKELGETRHADATITDLALRWGFADSSRFSRAFRRNYHISPREHRRAALLALHRDKHGLCCKVSEAA
jgi:NADP-dependent 3-hydroxy acid dehydrogenase YdfG